MLRTLVSPVTCSVASSYLSTFAGFPVRGRRRYPLIYHSEDSRAGASRGRAAPRALIGVQTQAAGRCDISTPLSSSAAAAFIQFTMKGIQTTTTVCLLPPDKAPSPWERVDTSMRGCFHREECPLLPLKEQHTHRLRICLYPQSEQLLISHGASVYQFLERVTNWGPRLFDREPGTACGSIIHEDRE
ncbi:unnamed protein product [Pleuronectes platessa]|uniref:Uncharacterized protein n=1 Tax=Pleuronectes platessa TaxID=8262 RepID=A0A9N7ZC64_PLEPL|nr:unnamed protein product [Pleuronectes platessa]